MRQTIPRERVQLQGPTGILSDRHPRTCTMQIPHDHALRPWLDRIYGPGAFAQEVIRQGPALVHVTALARAAGWATLRIGAGSPRSAHDFFALQFARARADAVVITGQLLRDEPELSYALKGSYAPALQNLRAQLGAAPLELVLLTRSFRLDPAHPVFHAGHKVHILSEHAPSTAIAAALCGDVQVHQLDALTLRSAVAFVQSELGLATVSLEAGPNTTRAAYEGGPWVDELLLSVYEGDAAVPTLRAPFSEAELDALLPEHSAPRRLQEISGPWSFCRRTRAAR